MIISLVSDRWSDTAAASRLPPKNSNTDMSSEKEIQNLYQDKNRAIAKSNWKEAAELCNFLGNKLCERGRLDDALAEHQEELKLCQRLKDEAGCALAHRCLGEVYSEMQDYKKALQFLKVFLEMSEKRKDMVEMQRAWATIGRAYLLKEDFSRAETAFAMALKLADKAKESVKEAEWIEMKCRSYLNLALIYDQRDDTNEGCRYYTMAIQLASKHNLKETLHRCQNSLALFYQKLKLYPRALKLLNEAIATVRTLKNKVFECEYLISKGHLLLLMNNLSEARKTFKKAVLSKSPVEEDRDKALAKHRNATNICKAMKLLQNFMIDRDVAPEEGRGNERRSKTRDLLRLHDKLGDLFSEAEVFMTAVHHYKLQLELAFEAGVAPASIAAIYVSIAQTLFDDKQYAEALEFFNKEREVRQGNPLEETHTTLKIIEVSIAMGKESLEIRELYESALVKFAGDQRCLKKILRDYALYLDQELEIEKASEIRCKLERLRDTDKNDGLDDEEQEQEEVNIDDDADEAICLTDVSCPSSSSDSEDEEKGSNRYLKDSQGRPKRSRTKKIKTNELGETPLHRACIEGDLNRVMKLLENGHPVNPRDHCGWLPIHEAANHDYPDIVSVLIDAGADLNDPGGEKCGGTTPLHDACNNCNVQVIKLLVQRGGDVCKFDQEGNTPLDCLRNWRKRVKQLSGDESIAFEKTIESLEEKMRLTGFDLDAERKRPVIQVNLSPDRAASKCRTAKLSRRRVVSDSPPSSPSPPCKKKSRKPDHDLDFDDPDVARGEYRAAIKSLRRTRDPGLDFDEEGEEEALRTRETALIDDSERVDVNDWLVDDMGKQRKGNYRELYESQHLPKKQVSKRTKAANNSQRVTSATTSSRYNEKPVSKDSELGTEVEAAEAIEVEDNAEERAVTLRDPLAPLPPAADEKTGNSKKQHLLISVHVDDKAFLIRVPDEKRLVSWLTNETINRYFQLVRKKPVIYLETPEGAILSPDDLIIDVTGRQVNARIQSFESLPLNVRYQENCKATGIAILPEVEQLLQRAECNGLLNLSHVLISGMQEKALLDSISSSSSLVSIDLSFRNLTAGEGKQTLLACLRQSPPQLRDLRLSGCGISSQDLTFLADVSLPISLLDLSYNSLPDDSLPALCLLISSLHKLTSMYLIACDFTPNMLRDEKLSHTVSTHVSLAQVFVDGCLIDVAGADLLATRFGGRVQGQKWKKLLPGSKSATAS